MHRSPSSADISTYDGCGEASKKLQFIANFILLTASLVLIGTGNFNHDHNYLELLNRSNNKLIALMRFHNYFNRL